jgi:hypothetical protein
MFTRGGVAGTEQIDVCDYLEKKNEGGMGEKLRKEAPWGGALCSRIGIWNFPQDDI